MLLRHGAVTAKDRGAASSALCGASGPPHLPPDLLLNTLEFEVATFPLLLLPCSSGC